MVEVEEEPIKDKLGGEDKGKGKLIEDLMSYQLRVPFLSTLKVKLTNKKNLAQNEKLMKLFKCTLTLLSWMPSSMFQPMQNFLKNCALKEGNLKQPLKGSCYLKMLV